MNSGSRLKDSYGSAAHAALIAEAGSQARFSDYVELTKPRLSLLSVLTALVGYLAAQPARAVLHPGQ